MEVHKLKVAELREELSKRELSISGLKPVLIKRLEEAIAKEKPLADASMSSSEEEDRGLKRRRSEHSDTEDTPSSDVEASSDINDEVRKMHSDLQASYKERERLQYLLEETKEKVNAAKAEGRKDAEQEFHKERTEMRLQLDTSYRKREELEFKLSQKEDELSTQSTSKTNDKEQSQHLKVLKEEIKRREKLEFQYEQMKEQVEEYKNQVRILQQKAEAGQLQSDRDKKEKERTLLEERGKAEALRLKLDSQRDELVKEWRKEFENKTEAEREELRKQIKETKKMQKELNDKTLQLEAELASRTKAELQRLSQLEKDLREQEAELREQEKLQEELQEALTNKQRSIEEDEARLESDKLEFEEKRQDLEKERGEFEDRLWMVERDVKKRRDREKALDEQILDLLAKNETLTSEKFGQHEGFTAQIRQLSSEIEMLRNSLALAQARVVSARPQLQVGRIHQQEEPTTSKRKVEEEEEEEAEVQTQLTKVQQLQSRDTLAKTRSRHSYLPKPSLKKEGPTTTKATSSKESKEGKENSNLASNAAEAPATKKRASMIPIRRGSSLLPQQIKALRD